MAQFFKKTGRSAYYLTPSLIISVMNMVLYALFTLLLHMTLHTASMAAFAAAILTGLIYLWPYCKKEQVGFFSTSTFLFALGWVGCAVVAFFVIGIFPTFFGSALSYPIYVLMSLLFIPVNLLWRWLWEKSPELVRYMVGGFATFLVSFLSYFFLSRFFPFFEKGIGMYVAKVISWVLAVIFSFFVNKYWVFENKTKGASSWFAEFLNFVAGRAVVSAIFELGLFALLVEVFHIYDMIALVVTTTLVVIANYFWSRFLTFNDKKPLKKKRDSSDAV